MFAEMVGWMTSAGTLAPLAAAAKDARAASDAGLMH